MTSAAKVPNAESSAAGKQHSAHEEPSHDWFALCQICFALCQIGTAQPPFLDERYAVAFSREVPVNAA
jgi:hypothetical protein